MKLPNLLFSAMKSKIPSGGKAEMKPISLSKEIANLQISDKKNEVVEPVVESKIEEIPLN